MAVPKYFVTFEENRHQTLAEFCSLLRSLERKTVGTIQLAELCSMAEYPNGVYLFFANDNELRYVGKSTSRSFIERIASHFDQRHDAWFATLPRRVLKLSKMAAYADAHAHALQFQLVLVGVKVGATAVKLENALRSYMKPTLNTKRGNSYDGHELLSSFET
jgi:hypothetical protein